MKRREDREVVAVNVLKSVVIIMWAITGTVNLIQGNIDRWDYLMVWGSLMAVLMILSLIHIFTVEAAPEKENTGDSPCGDAVRSGNAGAGGTRTAGASADEE